MSPVFDIAVPHSALGLGPLLADRHVHQPVVGVTHQLQAGDAVGPRRRCAQPKHGDHHRQTKVLCGHKNIQGRYVGCKFALQICIANGRKAFAMDDGRVNRKKIAKIFI